MRYPAFIAVMGSESNRPKLLMGVWSGYFNVAVFALLALLANLQGLIPWSVAIYALVLLKLLSNTLALVCLRARRLELPSSGLNIAVDVLVMTAAIYFTGGVLSPLLAIYVIEISVLALLTNLGITILIAVLAVGMYAAMALLVYWGVLPGYPPPVAWSEGITLGYLVTGLFYAAFVLGVPTFFTASILRTLRDKERVLEARTEALLAAGQQKSQFMANITHELRTPIHGILGLTQLVSEGIYGSVSDKQQEAMEGIRHSAKGLLKLIDDLLELSSLDAGKMELKPSRVELVEVCESVLSSVRWMQGTKELDLDLELAPKLPVVVADRGKLVQIMLNLVTNAVKFTPEGGRVVLRVECDSDAGVTIRVEDTGVGIKADELPHIFDEFRQVDGSSSREYGGVGLGLSLVRRLLDLMGGSIEVDSEENRGSTFTVHLPLVQPGES